MSLASTDSGHAPGIAWTRQANADLARLSGQEVDRIKVAVGEFARTGRGNILRMKGFDPPRSRLRVGSRRVMLEITPAVIRVLRVLHRREAYRKSARIPQEVPEVGDTNVDETSEGDAIVSATESRSLSLRAMECFRSVSAIPGVSSAPARRLRGRGDSIVRPRPERVICQAVRSLSDHRSWVSIFPSSRSGNVCPFTLEWPPLPQR